LPLPSSLRRLDDSYQQLSAAERAEFKRIIAGVKTPGPAAGPAVAASVAAFVRYKAPREADPGRRNAFFQSVSKLAMDPRAPPEARAPLVAPRDPGQTRVSVIGLGWRAADEGLATVSVLPAVRGFENTVNDGLGNSSLEIARVGCFFRPGRFGVYQFRAVHLDAQQAGSRFGDGFTRYLDASFEKSPNKDWSLHDEYRVHFGAGTTVGRGTVSASAVILTGPRYAVFEDERTFLWDLGVRASIEVWLGNLLRLRSQFQWIPLAPGDDRGLWSNLAALAVGPVSIVGGVESPSGNPLNVHGVGSVNYAF
jgi:hypothetical protein